MLGGYISALEGRGGQGMCAGRLDDAAPLFRFHVRNGQAGRVERACQVQRYDQVPLVDRKIFNRRDMLHACIVDQDIDAAKGAPGFLHHRFDLGGLGQVVAAVERLCPACLFQRLPFLFDRGTVAETVDDDVRAFCCQNLRISQANARCGARDQRSLSGEGLGHAFFSLRVSGA